MVDRGGRPRAPSLEPRQAVLARRGLHEGRPRELLRERRRADRAAPRVAPAHDEADARRRRRRVLLREDRALAHARLDRAVPRAVGGRQEGRDRLPDGERRGGAALRGEPRLHRDAPAALPLRRRRASRLPVLRPRPVPAVHVRGRADRRATHQDPVGPARPDRLPEDERGHGPADLPAGRARRLHLRAGARVRGRVRAPDHARRPRPHDDGVEDRRPDRQGLHRPQHEPRRGEHRGRVLDAARARRVALDAPHVGRGDGGRVRAVRLPDRHGVGAVRRAAATCSRRCARDR